MGEDQLGLRKSWVDAMDRLQAPLREDLLEVRLRIGRLLRAEFQPINEPIEHLFSRTGKMIRPTLLLLAANRERCDHDRLISIAAVVEIIHTASLVHDDSIDSSTHRRGVETLNSKWNHKTSVIIGDYMLARAFGEISKLANPDIFAEMSAACRSLAVGEMRQMSMEGNLDTTETDYLDFIHEKTSSLFSASCVVATLIGEGGDIEPLRDFGRMFGSIFQITDDLLDYVGSPPETGKPSRLDLRDKKMTLPLIHAYSRMSGRERAEVGEAFAAGAMSDETVDRLAELVTEYGGIEYAMNRVLEMADEAAALAATASDPERARKLKELVELIVERDR